LRTVRGVGLGQRAPALAGGNHAGLAVRRGDDDGPGLAVAIGQYLDQTPRLVTPIATGTSWYFWARWPSTSSRRLQGACCAAPSLDAAIRAAPKTRVPQKVAVAIFIEVSSRPVPSHDCEWRGGFQVNYGCP
jgi:hypothetical protein